MAQRPRKAKETLPPESRESESRQDPEESRVFARWLRILNDTGIHYVVGGAFAVHAYTGIWRDTKDLDVFLRPRDLADALNALVQAGFDTEIRYHHWLAKAFHKPFVMDLIFGVWNGQIQVDNDWFKFAVPGEVNGVKTRLIPVEELLSSKLYVAARDRFDGSDVVHLIRHTRGRIDWDRVLTRVGKNYELVLWHLILFDFIYPSHSDYLPQGLMMELFDKVKTRWHVSQLQKDQKIFRGTLLDQFSFMVDHKDWGYENPCDFTPLVDDQGRLISR